jgi:hypothetical protein
VGIDDERSEEQKLEDEKSISAHYGWLYILNELVKNPILQITGDKCITDVNLIFAFNYLSMVTEIELEKQQQQKQIKLK